MHQIGILGIPRRYFSYGEVYLNLNIVTFIGTLFTLLRWVILIVILYNVISGGLRMGGYIGYAESVYGGNLAHHTYIDGVAYQIYPPILKPPLITL
jgi:heme/copper-type cytochrome/quinol oxidase subunit 1